MNKHEQFTWLVAKGNSYADDYGCFCYYCHEQIGWLGNLNEADHKEDCAMLQARSLLGKKWLDHVKAKERKC